MIVQALIVNNTCPEIPAVKGFIYSDDEFFKYRLQYQLPTVENSPMNPLYYEFKMPLKCYYFYIKYSTKPNSYYLISEPANYKLLGPYTVKKNTTCQEIEHDYYIDYENILVQKCNLDIIPDVKLVAAKDKEYLVYWTCKNLTANSSAQGAIVLVGKNVILNLTDENRIMEILQKNRSDFLSYYNTYMFIEKQCTFNEISSLFVSPYCINDATLLNHKLTIKQKPRGGIVIKKTIIINKNDILFNLIGVCSVIILMIFILAWISHKINREL